MPADLRMKIQGYAREEFDQRALGATPTPCPLHMIFDQTIFNVGLYDSHRYHAGTRY